MMCSAGVGELAAALLAGRPLDWIDADAVAPARLLR
jgi:glycine/D-amino acid oxidase-like deaminating enzyme